VANSEDSLVHELKEQLEEDKALAWCYKLHGGPFQPGLPDLIVAMERKAALIEAKWATDSEFDKPLLEVCASNLSAKQAMNLGALGILDGPLRARVLIGGAVESDELPGKTAVVAVAYDVSDIKALREHHTVTLLEIASYLLDLRRGEKTSHPCAHLIQAQLRARAEKWMAGHLLCGIRWHGPIKATTDKEYGGD